MFSPDVHLLGGDHKIDKIGKYMIDIKENSADADAPIIIKDDVWVGQKV